MKKVLALVLAIAMISTVAFAAADKVWGTTTTTGDVASINFAPGSKITLDQKLFENLYEWMDSEPDGDFSASKLMNASNFAVTVKYSKGADLIASEGFVDNDYVIELKDGDYVKDGKVEVSISSVTIRVLKQAKSNYVTLTAFDTDSTKVVDKNLLVSKYVREGQTLYTATSAADKDSDYPNKTFTEVEFANAFDLSTAYGADWDVGYVCDWVEKAAITDYPVALYKEEKDAVTVEEDKANLDNVSLGGVSGDVLFKYNNEYDEDTAKTYYIGVWDSTASDRKVAFNYSNLVENEKNTVAYTADFTLTKGNYVKLSEVDFESDDYADLYDAFETLTADANSAFIYGFESTPLKSAATVTLGADEDAFIYNMDKDGKLSKANFKWNADDAVWTLSTKDLGGVVVMSDVELDVAGAADNTNPDTGANDVVGIASALAVVAVISAAAISLKK